jgi:hypothetical protein
MSANWVVGIAFAAVHYSSLDNYALMRSALCVATSVSGFLHLFLISLPKIYIMIHNPEMNVLCDDMEEMEHSDSTEISITEEDMTKCTETQRLPPVKEEAEENEVDSIKRATSADDLKTDNKRKLSAVSLEKDQTQSDC